MRKTIIDPTVGNTIVEGSETMTETAFSAGVAVDLPTHKQVSISGIVDDAEDHRHDVEAQTRTILRTIRDRLDEVDGSMRDVVRVRIYVESPRMTEENLLTIHEVRHEFFEPDHYPASTLVEISGLVRDNCVVEVDADAVIPTDGWDPTTLAG